MENKIAMAVIARGVLLKNGQIGLFEVSTVGHKFNEKAQYSGGFSFAYIWNEYLFSFFGPFNPGKVVF